MYKDIQKEDSYDSREEREIIMANTATMQKWGNSLGIRFPKNIVQGMGISQGSTLKMSLDKDGKLVIEKAEKRKKKYTLNELLEQCTDDKRHEIVDDGRVGKEIL